MTSFFSYIILVVYTPKSLLTATAHLFNVWPIHLPIWSILYYSTPTLLVFRLCPATFSISTERLLKFFRFFLNFTQVPNLNALLVQTLMKSLGTSSFNDDATQIPKLFNLLRWLLPNTHHTILWCHHLPPYNSP